MRKVNNMKKISIDANLMAAINKLKPGYAFKVKGITATKLNREVNKLKKRKLIPKDTYIFGDSMFFWVGRGK